MSSRITKTFGSVNCNNVTSNQIIMNNKDSVTQATGITSGVTINSHCGKIVTVSTTMATGGNFAFAVSNDKVFADSYVMANIIQYTGSAGTPAMYVDDITTGSFTVNVMNGHHTLALNGALHIAFNVV
jgi:hypothetical protein